MEIIVKENRELIIKNAANTQNENDIETIYLTVPEKYEDFNKKIAFVTEEGVKWGLVENNTYTIERSITKFENVSVFVWLTKGEQDFRSAEEALTFNKNHKVDGEITPEEQTDMERVISILESEITKTENLESQVDGKLEEIDTAIENINTAIQETENLDLDAEKQNNTTTVTITKKDGTEKSVNILDGQDGEDLQFIWQGTSLGIKTTAQQEYTFVNLQGVQGPAGPQGEPFTIKKTYTSIAQMNADFNNMQLGDYVMIATTVEVEDNAKLYTRGASQWIFITDFSGATGIRGETGLTPNIQIGTVTQGSSFSVTRTGTNENPILNFTLVKGDKGDKGEQGEQGYDYVLTAQDKEEIAGLVDVPVDDVQINGTSIVQDGVANVPVASYGKAGAFYSTQYQGFKFNSNNNAWGLDWSSLDHIKQGGRIYEPLATGHQHASTFYGLAKAAGDTTQSQSSNAVGTYTEDAKSAISEMLNGSVSVSGTTPTIVAKSGIRYVCGEVATLDFTPSQTGICDVVFTSGATATALTVPSTIKWANGFDPTALDANTTYEINIMDGLGVAVGWT